MAGLGGSYLPVVHTPLRAADMTAGPGRIALALAVFASWQPARLVLGAWLFGGFAVLQPFAPGFGVRLPSEFLSALPYLATVAVLVAMSRNAATLRLIAPASLAQPSFRPEH